MNVKRTENDKYKKVKGSNFEFVLNPDLVSGGFEKVFSWNPISQIPGLFCNNSCKHYDKLHY